MTCDQARLDLGGYIVDGLRDEENTAVEAHLSVCTDCRAEYDELRDLPRLLSLAVHVPPPPPARLRQQVLASASQMRKARRRTLLLQIAAALVAGVLLGGGAVWVLRSPSPEPAVSVALGPAEGFQATGSMELQPTDHGVRMDLALSDLAPLEGPEVYEAWVAPAEAGPTSVGTFRPDGRGTAAVTLWAAGPLERYESVWITLEPDHIDPAHDGPTVVEARLP